ncbi:MAG: TlpA disulfide reductase family protein [Ginsengibacter sp.]
MKKIGLITLLFMGFAVSHSKVMAETKPEKQNVSISGKVNLDDQHTVFVSYMNINPDKEHKAEGVPIEKNGTFKWLSDIKEPQFVKVSIVRNDRSRQLPTTFPLYLRPGMHLQLDLNYSDSTYLTLNSGKIDKGNKALFTYSNFAYLKSKDLFFNLPPVENSKKSILELMDKSEQLARPLKKKDTPIKEYLKIWSFMEYQSGLNSLKREYRRAGKSQSLPEDFEVQPLSPKDVYNSDMALYFSQINSDIIQYLQANLKEQSSGNSLQMLENTLTELKKSFTNKKVVQNVATRLLGTYIRTFKTDGNTPFEENIKDFRNVAAVIQNEEQRDRLIQDFSGLKYTFKGADMPDVLFKDPVGKEVAMRSFKGNYVYIDLWASWCVPCIAEVPYLKALEEKYKNKNITFISLSLDASLDDWKKKMKELDLHGNQLEMGDSGFDKLMNVVGIPHFVLYDPEGKLFLYKAPRPSSQEITNLFDNILL